MKQYVLITVLLALSLPALSQTFNHELSIYGPLSHGTKKQTIARDEKGNIFLLAENAVLKFDAAGNYLTSTTFPNTGTPVRNFHAVAILCTKEGDVIVTGDFDGEWNLGMQLRTVFYARFDNLNLTPMWFRVHFGYPVYPGPVTLDNYVISNFGIQQVGFSEDPGSEVYVLLNKTYDIVTGTRKIMLSRINGNGNALGDKIITMPAPLTDSAVTKDFLPAALSKLPLNNKLAVTGRAANELYAKPGPIFHPDFQPFLFLIDADLSNLTNICSYDANQYAAEFDVSNVIEEHKDYLLFSFTGNYPNISQGNCNTATSGITLMKVLTSDIADIQLSHVYQSECQYDHSDPLNNVIRNGVDNGGKPAVMIGFTDRTGAGMTMSRNASFLLTAYDGTPLSLYKRTRLYDDNHLQCFIPYDPDYFIEQSFDGDKRHMRLIKTDNKGYVSDACSFEEPVKHEDTNIEPEVYKLAGEDMEAESVDIKDIPWEVLHIKIQPCKE